LDFNNAVLDKSSSLAILSSSVSVIIRLLAMKVDVGEEENP
jgi:hypothetical protein